ncbi:MAG: polymer-forming cytoskeletal protein [Deltaproteobacteria bacterium]|nr:polymer-forming cytoskeletal protein [Deltaproteobacteria bacterium]
MAETSRPAAIQLSEIGAYLGPGTKANGKLLFEGATTIEGEIDGEILVHGNVTIGEHANIKGKIVATSALIRGKVTADIQVDKGGQKDRDPAPWSRDRRRGHPESGDRRWGDSRRPLLHAAGEGRKGLAVGAPGGQRRKIGRELPLAAHPSTNRETSRRSFAATRPRAVILRAGRVTKVRNIRA